jgi:hypothetical protein
MAICGLLLSIYLCFELKKPAEPNSETKFVELFNQFHTHEFAIKVFGEKIHNYTIYQFCRYMKEVIWQSFF